MSRPMKIASKGVILLFLLGMHLVIYQNCGTYEAANNPLTGAYDNSTSACVGLACGIDAEALEISMGNSEYYVQKPAAGVAKPATCDSTYCFDVSGYCTSAGYSDTVFYIEIQNGAGGKILNATRTSVSCDPMGRFRILVNIPVDYAAYDFNSQYSLFVTMKAIDDYGNEIDNPRGTNRKVVSIRSFQ
jgi:hypothetical protein